FCASFSFLLSLFGALRDLHSFPTRRSSDLTYGGLILRERRLLDGRRVDLGGGGKVLTQARGHLARRSGGAEAPERGVAVGDIGRRVRLIAHGRADVQIHGPLPVGCARLAEQIEVHAALS